MVVLQKFAEPFAALDLADRVWLSVDQLVVEALVVSLHVIMSEKRSAGATKRAFAEEYQLVEAFGFERENEPLSVCVYIHRQLHPLLTFRQELSGSHILFIPGMVVSSPW